MEKAHWVNWQFIRTADIICTPAPMMSQIVRLQSFGDNPEVWLEHWQVWTLKENPRSLWHSLGCESQLTTASDSERWMCFTHMDHTLVQTHQGDCVKKETWASNSKNKWTARVLALHYWPPQHPLSCGLFPFLLFSRTSLTDWHPEGHHPASWVEVTQCKMWLG